MTLVAEQTTATMTVLATATGRRAAIATATIVAAATSMAAAAAVTEQAGLGRALTAHQGDSNHREKDRDAEQQSPIHPNSSKQVPRISGFPNDRLLPRRSSSTPHGQGSHWSGEYFFLDNELS